jgi:hypothetical protein
MAVAPAPEAVRVPPRYPTALIFVDESAVKVSAGRFFVIGAVKARRSGQLLRAVKDTATCAEPPTSQGYPEGDGGQAVTKLMPIAVAVVLVVVAVVLGVVLSQRQSGPPPLGTGNNGAGLQCESADIAQPVTMGIFALENGSNETVTVASVRLVGGKGQKMTSPAYLVPIDNTTLLGAQPWPPGGAAWKLRKLAAGRTIAPHATTNLVFAQEWTTSHTRSAAVQVAYTASGSSYSLTEAVQVLVTANCS